MSKNIKLKDLEEEQEYEIDSNNVPPSDVVAFNELRSCAELARLYKTNQLDIKPDFQRDIVWSKPEQTRFIDSLTKQLPIPSMCISLDSDPNAKSKKRLVIDGLQRMTSIINFLTDDNWVLSKLPDIDPCLSGKKVSEIKAESNFLYEIVENVSIPITVIRCDYSKPKHNDYLFTIFHRLNSGGKRLNNQEIRNCIFNGSFNTLLKNLALKKESKEFFGNAKRGSNKEQIISKRFSDEEMILRFFAFNENLDNYNGRLAVFLSDYMSKNKNSEKNEALYIDSLNVIKKMIDQPYKIFSKTILEGLLYGVSQNIEVLTNKSTDELKELFEKFKKLPEFSSDNLKSSLSDKDKVKDRLLVSKNCFGQ